MLLHLVLFYITLFVQIANLSLRSSAQHTLNWTASISDSPILSAPFLMNSYGETHSDKLIVTTLDGSVTVINTASGEQEAPWPIHFTEKSFHAGPLIYDIDKDGSMEILVCSTDGEVLFLAQNGTLLHSKTIFLPHLLVKRKWNFISRAIVLDGKTEPDPDPSNNTIFIKSSEFNNSLYQSLAKFYVLVDTHVLATPVIGDFNNDGTNSELIVPVNYYFEDEIKRDQKRLKSLSLAISEVDHYLASGIIVIDLDTQETIFNVTLELTMKSSAFPGYLISSPTVVDLDGKSSEAEVIIGSMSGKIHVYNKAGMYSQYFDLSDAIHGEIAVGDLNNDGQLEIIAVDGSGNVFCYDDRKLMWEATVSGTITAGAQLVDIHHDNRLEVVIATNDGYLWILDAKNGTTWPKWPVKLAEQIHSKVLFRIHWDKSIDIIIMADDKIYIINTDKHTVNAISTTALSYVPVISDLQHNALIVATTAGKVLSFQSNHKEGNFTTNRQTGVRFVEGMKHRIIVNTAEFTLEFEIYDNQNIKSKFYNVTINFPVEQGSSYIMNTYKALGIYSVVLKAPQSPKKSYVSLELCNQFRECTQDVVYFTFYPKTKGSLALYMTLPFLVMVSLLLVLHGYPEGDLLPMWETSFGD